jgi:glycosyltransferase involved in cell wall biosynthesis
VITGNETGKKEILENYPKNPDKIKIVPFPIARKFFIKEKSRLSSDTLCKPFVFYPAQFWAHKNHYTLVKAITWLRDVHSIKLHCYFVGSDQGNLNYIQSIIQSNNITDQIKYLGFVDDETLKCLYQNALAMTFMSVLGPNNLPPIESFAMGCPVVISEIEGHQEQVRDCAAFFDPLDHESLGKLLIKLLTDTQYRDSLIESGYTFAESYKDYSYYKEVNNIIEEFRLYRALWG